MIDAGVYLRRVPLAGLEEATPNGVPVLDSWDRVVGAANRLGLADALALFARPSVTRSNGVNAGHIVWYGSASGVLRPFGSLPPDEREVVAGEISRNLMQLQPLADDPEVGSPFRAWFNVPAVEEDVFLVADRPIITNWGLLPSSIAHAPESRGTHFRQSLGRFLPQEIFPPPFSAEDASATAASTGTPATPRGPAAAGLAAATPSAVAENSPSAAPRHMIMVSQPRQWLPVAIATAVAAALLLLLLLPGVLIYPHTGIVERRSVEPALLAQTRDTLERRARDLETTLRQAACMAPPGGVQPGSLRTLPTSPSVQESGTGQAAPAPAPARPGAAPPPEPAKPQSAPGAAPSEPGGRGAGELPRSAQSTVQPLVPPSAASLAGPPMAGAQPSSLVAHLDKVTALVIASRAQGTGASVGSGFFINDRHLITNRHVIEGGDRIVVISRSNGRAMVGRVAGASRSSEIGGDDFAVIDLAPVPGRAVMTLSARVARGDSVIAAGFPSFVMSGDVGFQRLLEGDFSNIPDPAVTQGLVTALQTSDRGFPVMVHGAMISQGNSGGPLSDLCGRTVGVNTYGYVDAGNALRLNFALRSEGLKRFLDERRIPYTSSDEACEPTPIPRPPASSTSPVQGPGEAAAGPASSTPSSASRDGSSAPDKSVR
jgi:S1-C subfamily serine protease